jgi:hypothetical protein
MHFLVYQGAAGDAGAGPDPVPKGAEKAEGGGGERQRLSSEGGAPSAAMPNAASDAMSASP